MSSTSVKDGQTSSKNESECNEDFLKKIVPNDEKTICLENQQQTSADGSKDCTFENVNKVDTKCVETSHDGVMTQQDDSLDHTKSTNTRIRQPSARKSSLYRGVSRCAKDGRWQARIRIGFCVKYLGRFTTQDEAARCYDIAALKQSHRRAITNFRDSKTLLATNHPSVTKYIEIVDQKIQEALQSPENRNLSSSKNQSKTKNRSKTNKSSSKANKSEKVVVAKDKKNKNSMIEKDSKTLEDLKKNKAESLEQSKTDSILQKRRSSSIDVLPTECKKASKNQKIEKNDNENFGTSFVMHDKSVCADLKLLNSISAENPVHITTKEELYSPSLPASKFVHSRFSNFANPNVGISMANPQIGLSMGTVMNRNTSNLPFSQQADCNDRISMNHVSNNHMTTPKKCKTPAYSHTHFHLYPSLQGVFPHLSRSSSPTISEQDPDFMSSSNSYKKQISFSRRSSGVISNTYFNLLHGESSDIGVPKNGSLSNSSSFVSNTEHPLSGCHPNTLEKDKDEGKLNPYRHSDLYHQYIQKQQQQLQLHPFQLCHRLQVQDYSYGVPLRNVPGLANFSDLSHQENSPDVKSQMSHTIFPQDHCSSFEYPKRKETEVDAINSLMSMKIQR